jgi:hypothetical protein
VFRPSANIPNLNEDTMFNSIDLNRCQFTYADGRRCRMLLMEGHDSLCCHHWAREESENEAARAGAILVAHAQDLSSPEGLHTALCSLYLHVAQGKLPPNRAFILAYVAQLLLQSLAMKLRREKSKPKSGAIDPAA